MCARIREVFGVEVLPVAIVAVGTLGVILSYTTAVATGHIQPLCPLISITGAFPPESGILSIALIVIAPLLLAMVHIRYKHMKGFHLSQKAHFVNVITLICAAVAATGTVGVASFKVRQCLLFANHLFVQCNTIYMGLNISQFNKFPYSPSIQQANHTFSHLSLFSVGHLACLLP
jgi:hypothetical protein